MNKLIEITLASILLLSLSACIDEEDVKTKSFYIQNDKARIEKVESCSEKPDKQLTDQNCINSHSANSQLKQELIRDKGIVVDYSSAYEKKAINKKTASVAMMDKLLIAKKAAEEEMKAAKAAKR
jgi:hypothetical protein